MSREGSVGSVRDQQSFTMVISPTHMWQEFEHDRGVNWDVPSDAESDEGSEYEEGRVVGRCTEAESKDG